MPLAGTERTGGLEERRGEMGDITVSGSISVLTDAGSPSALSVAVGSLLFKSFTVAVSSLRDHLHDLIFLTIWTWKDFPGI